jgi:hypothetical protein
MGYHDAPKTAEEIRQAFDEQRAEAVRRADAEKYTRVMQNIAIRDVGEHIKRVIIHRGEEIA